MSVRRTFWKLSLALLLPGAAILLRAQVPTPTINSLTSSSVGVDVPMPCPLPNGITVGATLNQVDAVGFRLCINGNFTPSEFQNVAWIPSTGAPTLFDSRTSVVLSSTQIEVLVPPNLWSSAGTVSITVTEQTPSVGAVIPPRTSSPRQFFVNPPLAAAVNLPPGTVGTAYAQNLYSGGTAPYSNTLLNGPPPAGWNFPATGPLVTGIPQQAGTVLFAFTVTDVWGTTLSPTVAITVNALIPPLQFTTPTSLPSGNVGSLYSLIFSASGGRPPYTFSLISGAVPDGLTLSPAGILSGFPKTSGQYRFGLQVADSAQATASRDFTLVIGPPPLLITTGSPLAGGAVGTPYSVTFAATGGVPLYTWTASGVPAGLSISKSGLLSGTPAAAGVFTIDVTVTDSVGNDTTESFSLTIAAARLTIATASLPNGTAGTAYSATVTAAGGVPPYTFTANGLPPPLAITPAGVISGTPSVAGTFFVTVAVNDSKGANATNSYNVIIAPLLVISTASLPNGAAGSAYSVKLAATGGTPPYTWSGTGLPGGLSLAADGTISGTPAAAGSFTVNATVTESTGATATKSFAVTIAATLAISTASAPNGTVGSAYSLKLAATGGSAPYTWTGTGIPPGLALTADTLAGTPTAPGTSSFTATVTDSGGFKASKTFQIAISLPAAPAVTVSSTSNTPTQQTLQATLGAAYPLDVTVRFTLTFAPDSGRDDPTVLFANNTRTAQVVIPAGSTSAPGIGVQTGTVAGTITITAQAQALGQDITPAPAPRTIRINAAAPVLTNVTATRTATGFTVAITGYATSLDVTQAVFTFTASAGANLQAGQVTVPVTALFAGWYQSPASAPYGSQFLLTQPFTVQGNLAAVLSVSVTLVNSVGTSSAVSANLQ